MSKKKKILIAVILLVLIGIIFIEIKMNDKSGDKKETVDEKDLLFVNITDQLDQVMYKGKKVSIEIKNDSEDETIKHVFINNKEVFKTDNINMFIEKVYQFYDNILLITNGVEKNKIKIFIYKNDGTFVKEIRDLITDNMKISEYEVHENYISMRGVRLVSDHNFFYNGNDIDICDHSELEKNKIDSSIIMMGDYRLDYDLDEGFIVKIDENSKVTLREAKDLYCIR